MDVFARIAEERIRQAMENGEFANLSGHGKPLCLEDDSHVPPDLRMAYKILKNAGYVPEEVRLQKQISSTRDLLEKCTDEKEKYRQIQKLNLLITRINMRRRTPVNLEQEQVYYERIVQKVRVASDKPEQPESTFRSGKNNKEHY